MPQPIKYTRSFDFTGYQEDFPSQPLPAAQVDINLDNIAISNNQTIDNLGLIQRDDGALANQIVTPESLSVEVNALLGSPLNPRGQWLTATVYAKLDLVSQSGSTYIVVTPHTSGTFATDLAAGKLQFFSRSLQEGSAAFFQKLSGTGATPDFTLDSDVGTDPKALMIFYSDGGPELLQILDTALYTINGTALHFTFNPVLGANNLYVFAPSLLVGAASSSAATATTQAGISTAQAVIATNAANTALAAQAAAEAAAGGLRVRPNVRASTTGALPACTYANGASGVGATLTGNANGALAAQDGVTLVLNDELLVKDQAAQLQNGTYVLTQVGNAGAPFILTRRTDADQWAELVSMVVAITAGSTLASNTYITSVLAGGTVGVTAVTFVPFNTSILDGAVTTQKIAAGAVTGAKIANDVALAGSPTTTTQSAGDSTTKIATTAFVSASGRNSQGAKTISTSAPSGTPADGDIWYRI